MRPKNSFSTSWNRVREKIIEWWWIIAVIVAVVWLISAIFVPDWPDITGFNGKTIWDVLDLVIIPIILIVLAAWFNRIERKREEQQAKLDREIEQDRQREAVLQIYLDRITELLRHELGEPEPNEKVKAVARTLTVITMRRLDGKRNETLLRFLDEAGVISKDKPIIDFKNANLSQIDLSRSLLPVIDLHAADLRGADLRETLLYGSNLSGADLESANLSGADLGKVSLFRACLDRANLEKAFLHWANLREASLKEANLRGADLSGADLEDADLSGAYLDGAKYYSSNTPKWPNDFDPNKAGVVKIERSRS